MPPPGGCTSPRPRSASASRRSRSSSAACVLVRSKPARLTEAGTAVVRLARQVALLEHDALAELGDDGAEGARTTVPLAVNADSLATWFLEPLARLSERHPVVFELHRDDQDFTAGLLESGTVMGAVTSRATPVAGMPRERARGDALRGRRDARRSPRAGCPTGRCRRRSRTRPLVDFDRRDDLQTRWLRGVRRRRGAAAAALRARVERLRRGGAARARLGAAARLPVAASALDAGELVRLGGPPIDVPAVLAAVEPALAAAGRDRRRDRRRRAARVLDAVRRLSAPSAPSVVADAQHDLAAGVALLELRVRGGGIVQVEDAVDVDLHRARVEQPADRGQRARRRG